MDRKDLEILRFLQRNCKLSVREIAKRLKIPSSTVYARINKLEEKGVITGYHAKVDEKKLGYGVKAFILVSYTPMSIPQEEVANKIAALPQVQGVYIISGEWDMIVEVIEKDVESLGDFVIKKLRNIEGVSKTLTCVVLKKIKETTYVPVAFVQGFN